MNHFKGTVKRDFKILAIGGSAGSLSMVLKMLPYFTKRLNIAVVLIFHRKRADDHTLVDILSHKSEFQVKEVEDKESIQPHVIYLAPADYHLLIEKSGLISLDLSEKVNFSRPSIDVTFESAADSFGTSIIGLLLSGANADGVAGLQAIKKNGGMVIVQDPRIAQVPYMPQQALDRMAVDMLLSEDNLMSFIQRLENS